jgi:hypothetical protein
MLVIVGDHLFMGKINSSINRKVFAKIYSPRNLKLVSNEFSQFDFYPTVLAGLGFEISGDRLGLGANRYHISNNPTVNWYWHLENDFKGVIPDSYIKLHK